MKGRNALFLWFMCAWFLFVTACSDTDNNTSCNTTGKGTIMFEVNWVNAPQLEVGCSAIGVASFTVSLYGDGDTALESRTYPCIEHEGTIDAGAGTNRKLVLEAKDGSGGVVYRGEKTGITIREGKNTILGMIDLVPNTPPTATITEPADGSEFWLWMWRTFKGTGMDEEDGELTGRYLVWTSNIDGEIGTGRSVLTNSLSEGEHTITLTVTDRDGGKDTDTIGITIKRYGPIISIDPLGSIDPDADYTNSLGMTFNLIPAGTFTMGSPASEGGRGSDETQHQVMLTKPFYMQTTELTQGQWWVVMGSNPSNSVDGDSPVEQVSWEDVQAFIDELNTMGQGTYRLPTEAEWEYACRAGSTTAFANGGIFVLSGCDNNANLDDDRDANLDKMGWYCIDDTRIVAQKDANAWGLYDMHGNVVEWCSDWYTSDLGSEAVTDPTGPSSGSLRVGRGGGFRQSPAFCRSASRFRGAPSSRDSNFGLRLVREPSQGE